MKSENLLLASLLLLLFVLIIYHLARSFVQKKIDHERIKSYFAIKGVKVIHIKSAPTEGDFMRGNRTAYSRAYLVSYNNGGVYALKAIVKIDLYDQMHCPDIQNAR